MGRSRPSKEDALRLYTMDGDRTVCDRTVFYHYADVVGICPRLPTTICFFRKHPETSGSDARKCNS